MCIELVRYQFIILMFQYLDILIQIHISVWGISYVYMLFVFADINVNNVDTITWTVVPHIQSLRTYFFRWCQPKIALCLVLFLLIL